MKRLLILIAAMAVALMGVFIVSPAHAKPSQHVPVNVCHATSSDSNPFVFITVDDDSTKLQGHLAHRNTPNKTWKSDGTFNGTPHSAGDPKADLIQTYTDSDGVLHELDGDITADSCVNHDQPPVVPNDASFDTYTIPATCTSPGVEKIAYLHFVQRPVLDQSVGTHTVTFYVVEGHTFKDGSTSQDVTYTIDPVDESQCPVDLPKDATAFVGVSPGDCDSAGSAIFAAEFMTWTGESAAVGTHTAHFIADEGHLVSDSQNQGTVNAERTTVDITYTIPGPNHALCPKPPHHHKPPHQTPPTKPHHPVAPPTRHTTPTLPNAGIKDNGPNLVLGGAILLTTLGGVLLFGRKRA